MVAFVQERMRLGCFHNMVIDCFTYNGESDILEIHLNVLDSYVDQFVIVEAPTTFSGKPKPLYYELHKDRFIKFAHKIKYFVIDENYTQEEIAQADNSPNTKGASHWKREFLQKESIKKALTHLNDDDLVFIGDVDEVWSNRAIQMDAKVPTKLLLNVYTYYLNNRSSEVFWGTLRATYGQIKGECLNHLRSIRNNLSGTSYGCHFTSMGGYDEVKRKLSDSYTRESYWTNEVENNLKDNVEKSQDFLGRGFTYKLDTNGWPTWLKNNQHKYEHLLRK